MDEKNLDSAEVVAEDIEEEEVDRRFGDTTRDGAEETGRETEGEADSVVDVDFVSLIVDTTMFDVEKADEESGKEVGDTIIESAVEANEVVGEVVVAIVEDAVIDSTEEEDG